MMEFISRPQLQDYLFLKEQETILDAFTAPCGRTSDIPVIQLSFLFGNVELETVVVGPFIGPGDSQK